MEPSVKPFQEYVPKQNYQRPLFPKRKTRIQSRKLTNMQPGDDPESFLHSFERAAEAALWPKEEWPMYLALLLSGEARAIYQTLPNSIADNYDAVKEAILDRLTVSEKSYQLKFRSLTFTEEAIPQTMVDKLRDWSWRWLKPDVRSSAEIVELIIMEQFLHILPEEVAEWISHHKLWSLDVAVQLVEDYLSAAEGLRPASPRGVSDVLLPATEEEHKILRIHREEPKSTQSTHGSNASEDETSCTLRLDSSEDEHEVTEALSSEHGGAFTEADENRGSSPELPNQWELPYQEADENRGSSPELPNQWDLPNQEADEDRGSSPELPNQWDLLNQEADEDRGSSPELPNQWDLPNQEADENRGSSPELPNQEADENRGSSPELPKQCELPNQEADENRSSSPELPNQWELSSQEADENSGSSSEPPKQCELPNQWELPNQDLRNHQDSLFPSPADVACLNIPSEERLRLAERQLELDASWTMWRDPNLAADVACVNIPSEERLHLAQRQLELDAAWTMWRDPTIAREYSPVREGSSALAQLLPNPDTSPWNSALKMPASLKKIEGMSLDDRKNQGTCTEKTERHNTLIKGKKTCLKYSQHADKNNIDNNFFNLKRISWRRKTLPAKFRLYQTTDSEGSVTKLEMFAEQQSAHTCTDCGKGFRMKKKLIAHQSLHKGDKKQKSNVELITPKEQNQKSDRSSSEPAAKSKLDGKSHNGKRIARRKRLLSARFGPHQTMDYDERVQNVEILTQQQRAHTCTDCGKVFSLKKKLVAHQSLHKGDKKDQSNLDATFTKEHNHECGLAENSNIDDASRNELRILDSQTLLPASCGSHQTTDHESVAKLTVFTEPQGTHTCTDCGDSCNLKELMIAHQSLHKGEDEEIPNLELLTPSEENQNSEILTLEEKSYTCLECGKSLRSASTLRRHKQSHAEVKKFKCDLCGKRFAQHRYLVIHNRIHTGEKPYTCDECGMSFTWRPNLKKHLLSHEGKKPYTCNNCGKSFHKLANLVSHKRQHTEDKPHQCRECGKSFPLLAYLTAHHRIHTGEKPYTCNECGKSFRLSIGLVRHKAMHTTDKPYTCDECGKCFRERLYLLNHRRKHTGEKLHNCSKCGKKFLSLENLAEHQTLHTGEKPFTCDTCGKSFRRSQYLVKHNRIHTGEKPYKCDECGKAFRVRDGLRRHARTHKGEKPYACIECGRTFSILSNLVVHRAIHARDEDIQSKKVPLINLGTRVDIGDCKCVNSSDE